MAGCENVQASGLNRQTRVGPLSGHRHVWAFTALGSKGLLLAPLLGAYLPQWLPDPASVPAEMHRTQGRS